MNSVEVSFVEIWEDQIDFIGGDTCKIADFFKPTYYKATKTYINEEIKPLIIIGKDSLNDIAKFENLDRYFKFADSNIWVRYVQKMNGCKKCCLCTDTNKDQCQLNQTINELKKYNELGLYKTKNAIEIIEFKARMAQNSYLSEVVGGHSKHVVPFLFHSENEMSRWAVGDVDVDYDYEHDGRKPSELKKLKQIKDKTNKLEWRFLLIDDHATYKSVKKELKKKNIIVDDILTNSPILPKCLIIRTILSPYFVIKCLREDNEGKECCSFCTEKIEKVEKITKINPEEEITKKIPKVDEKLIIHLDCATSIDEAKKAIGKTKYDLILMDYLLDYEENGKEKRYYAYELLQSLRSFCKEDIYKKEEMDEWEKELYRWIPKSEENKNKLDYILNDDRKNRKKFLEHWKGPNGRFHFFFISAFTNAISERMLEKGLNFFDENWNINRGACPTTTPHLFLYYLLKTMNFQIQFLKTKLKDTKKNIITLLDLLEEIYCDEKDENDNLINNSSKPSIKAIKYFNSLLQMRLTYDKLKYDACLDYAGNKTNNKNLNSPLVTSFFPDIVEYDNAFWEHVMHLVYLTAYGTIRQWPDMWDEFILIKPFLQKAFDEKKKDINGNEVSINPKAKDVILGIENYIISIQNQNR